MCVAGACDAAPWCIPRASSARLGPGADDGDVEREVHREGPEQQPARGRRRGTDGVGHLPGQVLGRVHDHLVVQEEGQVRPRSGLALKQGLTVLNAPGTIDSDYRGDLGVILVNLSAEAQTIEAGDRVAQLLIAPVVQATLVEAVELSASDRGAGGFGSTGRR